MLLKNAFNGNLQIEVLLIEDDIYASGLHVLKEILNGFIKRKSTVHYFSYERHKITSFEPTSDVKIYDCFSSNCPWFNENATQNDDIFSLAETLTRDVPSNQQVFVIDSLSYFLLQDGSSKLNRLVDKLSSVKYKSGLSAFPVIMVLHDFNVENLVHRQLESMSNLLLKIENGTKQNYLKLTAVHKKASGKLVTENYSCWLEPESNKFSFQEIKEEVVKPKEPDDTNMAELTTFKLTLEDKEIESRNKLVLPYMRRQEEKGKIFYEPDANDDWDEEDPDDDLEI